MTSRPSWEIIASLWLHFLAAIVLVLFERCAPTPSEPLFKPNEVMRVQLAAAPKPKASRTQRAERAPEPPPAAAPPPAPSQTEAATTKPAPTPPPPKPPPASEMALRQEKEKPPQKEDPKAKAKAKATETAPKAKADTPPKSKAEADPRSKAEATPQNNADARAALVSQQRGQANPSAPLGTVNREEAGPDGVEGATASPIGYGEADPALAAYILACQSAILPNWTPLPTLIAEHPEYAVIVQVPVAADGTLDTARARIIKGSGDSSFDRTALMALAKTRRLPPPPAEWQASAAKGVQIRLAAKDK